MRKLSQSKINNGLSVFQNPKLGVADFMYENDFFYAETPVPDVKFHVWNIQIHTSIQQRPKLL